jgi:hypothetical protein
MELAWDAVLRRALVNVVIQIMSCMAWKMLMHTLASYMQHSLMLWACQYNQILNVDMEELIKSPRVICK